MRKILFVLVIILLLIFTGIIIYKGTKVGNFEIWGITDVSEKNKEIDEKNEELYGLVNVTYPQEESNLKITAETLQETKKEYENQAILLADSKYYKQTEKYKLEFLWTRIGNYAKDNKVVIKIDVTNSATKELYDLNFTAAGRYANIAQFIYNIENDSRLGFKIEDFSMKAVYSSDNEDSEVKNTNSVEGKFTCKEIRIDLKNIDTDTSKAKADSDTDAENVDEEESLNQEETTKTNSANAKNVNSAKTVNSEEKANTEKNENSEENNNSTNETNEIVDKYVP